MTLPAAPRPTLDEPRPLSGSGPQGAWASGDVEASELTVARWVAGILLRWRAILAITALVLLAVITAIIVLPPSYESQSSFYTNPSTGASRAAPSIAGALGGSGLAGMVSSLGGGGGSDPSESPIFYHQLLGSRELLTRLLQSKFPNPRTSEPSDSAPLIDILKIRTRDPVRRTEKAVERLQSDINSAFDMKTSVVTVTVDAEFSPLAAQMANRIVELVNQFNLEGRQSRGRVRRRFLERRLREVRSELQQNEEELRRFYDLNRQFMNSSTLRFEEARLRRQADMKADQFQGLQRDYESAQLDEVNDGALITVIDRAIPSAKPVWPRMGLLLGSALFVGLMLGVIWAGITTALHAWSLQARDEASQLRLALDSAARGIRGLGRRRPA